MALHPVGDQLKVKVDSADYDFGGGDKSSETGIVVEVPEVIHWFGKHNQIVEQSFMARENLAELLEYYRGFMGKRIYWESLQEKGRRFKEGDNEFVYLKLTDVMIYADDPDDPAYNVHGAAGGTYNI